MFLIILSILPFIPHQHWIFRVPEFGKIQIFILFLPVFAAGFLIIQDKNIIFWSVQALILIFMIVNAYMLIPYTAIYRSSGSRKAEKHTEIISLLSVNVLQYNKEYQRLIKVIEKSDPDVILTMESNRDWEKALQVLDKKYPNHKKIPFENTYGMHFYTRLKTRNIKVNFFISDDMPSIEAELETKNGYVFTVFGTHPAPPSPTEEENSKERDGELLSIAKKVKKIDHPVIVMGDFNNVAWASSSKLFRRMSQLVDPRIGRGFVSTYHAEYRLLRFPIDLFFHSKDIFIEEFKTLERIGSDHLPLFCKFFLNTESPEQLSDIEKPEEDDEEDTEEMIKEGKKEESENRSFNTK